MKLAESLRRAQLTGGIVYKFTNYDFAVTSSLLSFATLVVMEKIDECMYEVVSNQQTTYLDLDLKTKEYKFLPKKLIGNTRMMAEQCLELLTLGYERYLNTTFTRDHVTFGDSCGAGKLSYHIIIYNKVHA